MKLFYAFLLVIALTLGGSQNAHADQLRNCVGPYTLSSVNFSPGSEGVSVKHIDGTMTVHTWKTGAGAISFNVEASNFTALEDPTGDSFFNLSTRTDDDNSGVGGPFERMRLNVTSCTSDCTTKVKICGRIAN